MAAKREGRSTTEAALDVGCGMRSSLGPQATGGDGKLEGIGYQAGTQRTSPPSVMRNMGVKDCDVESDCHCH